MMIRKKWASEKVENTQPDNNKLEIKIGTIMPLNKAISSKSVHYLLSPVHGPFGGTTKLTKFW